MPMEARGLTQHHPLCNYGVRGSYAYIYEGFVLVGTFGSEKVQREKATGSRYFVQPF